MTKDDCIRLRKAVLDIERRKYAETRQSGFEPLLRRFPTQSDGKTSA